MDAFTLEQCWDPYDVCVEAFIEISSSRFIWELAIVEACNKVSNVG